MTSALASSATPAPPVRLRPAPPLEPPYDDELDTGWPADDPARRIGPYDVELPLDWGRRIHRPGGRTANRHRATRPGTRTAGRPGPSGWQVMPEEVPVAIKRFVDMYVEVLNERRPLVHLAQYATNGAFQTIRMGLLRRRKGWWPVGPRAHSGRRAAQPTALRARPMPIMVQRLRSCEPRPGAVEVAVVLRRGDETRAMAVRLEREGQAWTCTALEFVS